MVVAVSGGRDSMVLLRWLLGGGERGPADRWGLVVAHFDHGWRGTASGEDAAWVAAEAGRLGLRVVLGKADAGGEGLGNATEAAARVARHRFLVDVARGEGASVIALAHHAEDQVEGFLLRLLRGAGGVGLGGMEAWDPSPVDPSIRLWRPLLDWNRHDLERRAREWGVRWREDPTNRDPRWLRNRVRHELIPLLESRFQPALTRVLSREQALLRDQARVVEDWARGWLDATSFGGGHGVPFGELPVAVQREVLRVQLDRLGFPATRARIEALRLRPGRRLGVGRERWLHLDPAGRLVASTAEPENPPHRPEACRVDLGSGEVAGSVTFAGGVLEWRLMPGVPPRLPGWEYLDADRVGSTVCLRHWQPGDRFRPLGNGGSGKLQDHFTNAKVPWNERRWRVLAEKVGGGILWVEGLRLGELAKVTEHTRRVLAWGWARKAADGPGMSQQQSCGAGDLA